MKDRRWGFLCVLCGNTGQQPGLIQQKQCFPLPELQPLDDELEKASRSSGITATEACSELTAKQQLQLEELASLQKQQALLEELMQLEELEAFERALQEEEDQLEEALRQSAAMSAQGSSCVAAAEVRREPEVPIPAQKDLKRTRAKALVEPASTAEASDEPRVPKRTRTPIAEEFAEPAIPEVTEPAVPLVPATRAKVLAEPTIPEVAEPAVPLVPATKVLAEPTIPEVAEPAVPLVPATRAKVLAEPTIPEVVEPAVSLVPATKAEVLAEPTIPEDVEPAVPTTKAEVLAEPTIPEDVEPAVPTTRAEVLAEPTGAEPDLIQVLPGKPFPSGNAKADERDVPCKEPGLVSLESAEALAADRVATPPPKMSIALRF